MSVYGLDDIVVVVCPQRPDDFEFFSRPLSFVEGRANEVVSSASD